MNSHRLGLRLADKRSLPCPKRLEWLAARDELYEEIMQKAWYPKGEYFGQSYEEPDVLDSSLMIMPLVFFSTPVGHKVRSGDRILQLITKSPGRSEVPGYFENDSSLSGAWRFDFECN